MSVFIDSISWLAILGGAFFSITGAVGLFRFPDFYSRVHGAGMTDTLGILLILFGLMLQNGWDLNLAKYFLIAIFILLTGTTATHALAKAARHGGLKPILSEENKPTSSRNNSNKQQGDA